MHSFLETYMTALAESLRSFEEGQVVIFKDFSDRFGEVAAACERWQIGTTHAHHFEANAKETGEAMEQLIAAKDNSASAMKALASVCSHTTSDKNLKDIINNGKAAYKTAAALIQDCDKMAGLVLLAGIILKDSPSPADVKTTMEMASRSFGLSLQKLPVKMQKLLSEIAKQHGLHGDEDTKDSKDLKKKRKPESGPQPGGSSKASKKTVDKADKGSRKRKESKEKKNKKEKKASKKLKKAKSEESASEGDGDQSEDIE
eukprot:Skav234729  [mRNA]  locus=scaffold634:746002:746778:- [translate_table: standard]